MGCHCLCSVNHPTVVGCCTAEATTSLRIASSIPGLISVQMCSSCAAATEATTSATVGQSAGRFNINPGPLKVVPARQRQWGRSTYDLAQDVRCKATTKAGIRCERTQANDSDYCWQHARQSK
jgi:hypothetical protein